MKINNNSKEEENLFNYKEKRGREIGICPHCKAKMVEYKHGLSKALIEGLTRLAKSGGRANIKILGLTRNQWDNFQKLRYWDLVKKSNDNGNQKGGWWEVTPHGWAFLNGDLKVNRSVITYRGERSRYEGELVGASTIVDGYKFRPEYANQASEQLSGH